MLKAVREIGQYIREKENLDAVQILTETSKLANTKKMICVVFKKENDDLVFDSVHTEDFSQEKARKILYRTFGHNQYDATLTAKFGELKNSKELVEKLERRWALWFGKHLASFSSCDILKQINNAIEKNKKEVFQEISEKYNQLKKEERKNCIITIKIKDNDGEKYLGEIPEFIEIFKVNSQDKFYKKHNVESKGNGICSMCMQKGTVMPASPFFVFTVDKVGFAYEFERSNSWKQLPICFDCALDLQVGKEFLRSKLSFQLYGYRYFVVPTSTQKEILEEIISEIELYGRSRDYRDGLLNAEEDILEILKEKKDVFSLIFVFYKTKGKDDFFDILKYIEEVPPSWIKKIYDTFRGICQKSIFKEEQLKTILGEKWSNDFIKGRWNGKEIPDLKLAGMVKDFFYHREQDKKVFDKSSLNILGKILESKRIDRNYFIKHLIGAIREEHNRGNEWNEKLLSLKSFYLLNFLMELGLIPSYFRCEKFKEVKLMVEKTEYETVEKFFNEFPRAFDTPDKKAVFLEGVLVSFLLDLQYAKRKDTPFRKKLHGLKLNKKLVKRLFPETMEKLRQYDAGYPWLETLISKYFIEADENGWVISDDEISYYFALGLNFGKLLKGGGSK